MKVVFTGISLGYACDELARSFANHLEGIEMVARGFESRKDSRTLVVVLCCPCCSGSKLIPEMSRATSVLVTPFKGIDPAGFNIAAEVDMYPPGGLQVSASFLSAWRETIEKALA